MQARLQNLIARKRRRFLCWKFIHLPATNNIDRKWWNKFTAGRRRVKLRWDGAAMLEILEMTKVLLDYVRKSLATAAWANTTSGSRCNASS
jgi:hypothetical protein